MSTFTLLFVNFASSDINQSVIPNGTTAKIYDGENNTLLDTKTVNNNEISTSVLSLNISNNYYITFSGSGAPTGNFYFSTGYAIGNTIVISINPPQTSSNNSGSNSGSSHIVSRYLGSHVFVFGSQNTNSYFFAGGISITERFASGGITASVVSSPQASLQIVPPPVPEGCTDQNLECIVQAFCSDVTIESSVEFIQFQTQFYNGGSVPVFTSESTSYVNPLTNLGLPYTSNSTLIVPISTTAINLDFQFLTDTPVSLQFPFSLFVYVTINSIP